MKKYQKRFEGKVVDDPARIAFNEYHTNVAVEEQKLHDEMTKGDHPASGKTLRRAINDLKSAKHTLSGALYRNKAVVDHVETKAGKMEGGDRFATAYWGVELEHYPGTDYWDYKKQEKERQAILKDAVKAGYDAAYYESLPGNFRPDYIYGKGEGTYMSLNYKDELVRNIMREYEDDMSDPDLKLYWSTIDRVLEEDPALQTFKVVWEKYLQAPNKSDWLQGNTLSADTLKDIKQFGILNKQIQREEKGPLDRLLYKHGFTDTFLNGPNKLFEEWWRAEEDGHIKDRWAIDGMYAEWERLGYPVAGESTP